MIAKVLAYLRNTILAGILVVAPLAITGLVAWYVIVFLDGFVTLWLPKSVTEKWVFFGVPGIGAIIAVIMLIIIGALAKGVVAGWFHRSISSLLRFLPVPLLGTIYATLRQLLETIFSDKSAAFREVVMIEYPRKDVYALGFVTGTAHKSCQNAENKKLINVFVPTTPNPTSGFLLMLDEKELTRLDLSVEDGIKLVVSSGIVTPEMSKEKQQK